MRTFSNLSIRWKLICLVLLASGLALVCVVTAALLYEATTFRPRTRDQLQREAAVLEAVLQAPLRYGAPENAERYLNTRRVIHEISIAALYDDEGKLFAEYRRPDAVSPTPTTPQPVGTSFTARELALWHPIREGDRVIGHLYVLEDLPPLYARLPQYTLMVSAVLLALGVVGTVLLRGVQRSFLRPLASLVSTTSEVTRRSDFQVRATVGGEDELGQLAHAFNQMLETIGQRDVALREASTRIQNVFDAATEVAIVAADPQGVITVFNTGAERMLGYQAGEVVGKQTPLMWHDPAEVATRSAALTQELGRTIQGFDVFVELARQGQSSAQEWTYLRKDGGRVPVNLVVTAMRDARGNPSGFLGISSDITARKLAEDAFRQSEQQFRIAFDNAPTGMSIIGPDGFTYLAVNPLLCEMFGHSKEEFLGNTISLVTHPDDEERSKEWIRKKLNDEPCEPELEKRFIHKDGHIIWGLVRAQWIRGSDGSRRMAIAHILDITERKQAETALREAEEMYRAMFQIAPDGMTLIDLEGRISFVSPKALEIYGVEQQEAAIGKFIVDYVATEDRARALGCFEDTLRGQLVSAEPFTLRRHDGSQFTGEISTAVLREAGGNPKAVLAITRDITERRRAVEALRESQAGLEAAQFTAKMGSWEYDVVTKRVIWSKEMFRLFDLDPETDLPLQDTYFEAIHPEDRATMVRTVKQVEAYGGEIRTEFRSNPARGPLKHFASIVRSVRNPDGSMALLTGTVQDITERKQAEHALQASERYWRTTFDAIGDAVALVAVDGQILKCNAAMEKLAAKPAEGIIGRRCCEVMHHAEAPVAGCPLVRAQQTHRRESVDLALGDRFYEVTVDPLFDSEGRMTSVVHIMSDITERKRMERALKESEALYRRAIEVAGAVPYLQSYSATEPTVRYEFIGEGIRQMTGYGPEEFSDTLMDSIIEERVLLGELAAHSMNDAIQRVRRGLSPIWQCEYRVGTRDGQIRWLFEAAVELSDENGTAHGSLGLFQDITERKQAEERIREQAALLEATHDAIIVWNVGRGVQFMNPAAEELTGRSAEAARGQDLSQVLQPQPELVLRAALQEVTARGSWAGELVLRTAANQTRVVASRWTVLAEQEGKPASMLITCNDITEKKQLEDQYLRAQRLESVGTLASGVAHDLNNILSPIIMGVEMLNMNPVDEETRSILAMMQESARRGRDTVKQLLTFARGTDSQKGPVQPRHLVKEIARLLQQTFPKNIQIYTDYAEQPATVLADPSQLHQVLMNLCVNARDAMPEGGVLFVTLENKTLDQDSARIHPKARPISYVAFKVSDSGAGIPAEVLDRIFDPFFTTKPQGKGTGLGLATVLGIVEGHGGFVTVESKPGHGTTFQVYIPASGTHDTDFIRAESPVVARGQGELVLVVDDEEAILRMAEGVLRRGGYTTLTATSASQALSLYEKHHDRIRAVLTDIMMPFGDGRQFIAMLYAHDPKLPIIAMSGHATSEFQQETLRRGARAFIGKPFSAEQLLATLGEVLRELPR